MRQCLLRHERTHHLRVQQNAIDGDHAERLVSRGRGDLVQKAMKMRPAFLQLW